MATRPAKARNANVDAALINARSAWAHLRGYNTPRYLDFCRKMLSHGFVVTLYEARKTNSKYVTVSNGDMSFKVRFSDHRPIPTRERDGDCDFFVGVTNRTVTTTDGAIKACLSYFQRSG